MMGCRRGFSSYITSWIIVITLLWESTTLGQSSTSPLTHATRGRPADPSNANRNKNLAPSSGLGVLAKEGALRQKVLIIARHSQIERLRELRRQLENVEADERGRIQGQRERVIRIIEDELEKNGEGLKISLQDITFSEDGIIIRMRVDGLDLYAKVDKRGEIRIEEAPIPTPHHPDFISGLKGEGASYVKERIIADIKTWEERLKEKKKDLAFRERAHRAIEGLVYKFYNFVDKDDFKPLREIFMGAAVPSGENIWNAFKRITPIEVLDGVTGVIGEMPIGAHLRETVENINRLVRFNEEDMAHFKDLQPEYLATLKKSMDTIWQSEEDRVILYLASILHDYGMFLRNYGTNSHAVDGERMIKPLIERLVQNGIITQEQGEIILALIGGHVLIRVALGYIPPRNVFRGLIDLVVQERFLRCLRVMYFSDCAATPLFQSTGLINEMAMRTIKYTDREIISNLDRLRLLSGGKDISRVEPWFAGLLDVATFDMPTEILLFTQLEPEILIKFLYYLNELRRHFDTAPNFLFIVNNDSSTRITEILESLDFSQITPSAFPAKLDRGQIVVQIKGDPRIPAFKYSESHLPIEREGAGYTERGEVLIGSTPVPGIDKKLLKRLRSFDPELPSAEVLYKAIRKVIGFYRRYGENDVNMYAVEFRRGLKMPLGLVDRRTIVIDIDLLKIPPEFLTIFLIYLAGHEGSHSLFRNLDRIEEEVIVSFTDALRFMRLSRKTKDAIIGAFRNLRDLKDTRYVEFLEKLKDDPSKDIAGLIEETLQINPEKTGLVIFRRGEPVSMPVGIDEIFSSFSYPEVEWGLVVTRKGGAGGVTRKKIVLFDKNGRLITDEESLGIRFSYFQGNNQLFLDNIYLRPWHQKRGLEAELASKIEEIAVLNGFEKKSEVNKEYFSLAQVLLLSIIPHINPDLVSGILPKEGPWQGRKYTREEIVGLIVKDQSGSLAGKILDIILSEAGLDLISGLPEIELTPRERLILQVRLKQLNLEKERVRLNDILDSIYIRTRTFNGLFAKTKAVLKLEDLKDDLSKVYLLVDMDRLDSGLAGLITRLRKQGVVRNIIWASHMAKSNREIVREVSLLGIVMYRNDIVVSNPKNLGSGDYSLYIRDLLSRCGIPLDKLILITTEGNYNSIYRHIEEGYRRVLQKFTSAGNIKLVLTKEEFDFLTPYLDTVIISRFRFISGSYSLEIDPLTEDINTDIERIKEAQEDLAKAV